MDEHLKIVRECVWEMRANWCDIGVELGIKMGILKV